MLDLHIKYNIEIDILCIIGYFGGENNNNNNMVSATRFALLASALCAGAIQTIYYYILFKNHMINRLISKTYIIRTGLGVRNVSNVL